MLFLRYGCFYENDKYKRKKRSKKKTSVIDFDARRRIVICFFSILPSFEYVKQRIVQKSLRFSFHDLYLYIKIGLSIAYVSKNMRRLVVFFLKKNLINISIRLVFLLPKFLCLFFILYLIRTKKRKKSKFYLQFKHIVPIYLLLINF